MVLSSYLVAGENEKDWRFRFVISDYEKVVLNESITDYKNTYEIFARKCKWHIAYMCPCLYNKFQISPNQLRLIYEGKVKSFRPSSEMALISIKFWFFNIADMSQNRMGQLSNDRMNNFLYTTV